uniref:G-type lectin S-receptor-like serine/threonine-protein kinase RKS1 n=1 Tax=Fragaria vesca subsp. vesca TaxID=101020 RepID=UPI0005CB4102|nr:PREDICTED: G-type lectin S-receptor-like serine/threonine-protein kinase RKS1 [Fragaria vesca subsp. vesca]
MSITLEGVVDCLTWYDNLMDILIYTKVGRDLYVRVDKVSLAEARHSKGFFRSGKILIPVLTALVALLLITMLALWLLKKKGKKRDYLDADELEESNRHTELQFFDLRTIIAATDNFSDANKLGQGGFGCVYKVIKPISRYLVVFQYSNSLKVLTEKAVYEY